MPTTRKALQQLLSATEKKISEIEARMIRATTDDQRLKLVEMLADLHVSQEELRAALTAD